MTSNRFEIPTLLLPVLLGSLFTARQARATSPAAQPLFEAKCALCHGKDGRAKTGMGPPMKIRSWATTDALSSLSDPQIAAMIKHGNKTADGKQAMPPFDLSAAQVSDLTSYIRAFQAK